MIASPKGRDVYVYLASLRKDVVVRQNLKEGSRAAWIVVAKGCVELNGKRLTQFSSTCVTSVPSGPDGVEYDGSIELAGRSDDAEVFLIDTCLSKQAFAHAAAEDA